jgi:hypothetical protein
MSLTLTLWIMAALTTAGALCGWRGALPPNPHRGPRMLPWRFMMLVCVAVDFMLLVHVVNLLGFHTGRWTPI